MNGIRSRIKDQKAEMRKQEMLMAQDLYAIWKEKLYHDWGHDNFEDYTVIELGMTKQDAVKLVRNYLFMESEAPHLTQSTTDGSKIPTQASITPTRTSKASKDLSEEHKALIFTACFDELRPAKYIKDLIKKCKQEYANKSEEELKLEDELKALKRYELTLDSLVEVVSDKEDEILEIRNDIVEKKHEIERKLA